MDPIITTYTGKRWDYLNPRAEDVDIVDIANALGNCARWAGHSKTFYSVAQHSVMVAMFCNETSVAFALKGLLHDASEAYLLDLPTPLKKHPAFAAYADLEAKHMRVIGEALNIDLIDFPQAVHEADDKAKLMEDAYLMNAPHLPDNPYLKEDGTTTVGWTIQTPRMAAEGFLRVYHTLQEELKPKIILA